MEKDTSTIRAELIPTNIIPQDVSPKDVLEELLVKEDTKLLRLNG